MSSTLTQPAGIIGGETEKGRGRPQEGRSPETPGGDRRREEGQEGFHDTREEEETSGRHHSLNRLSHVDFVYFSYMNLF